MILPFSTLLNGKESFFVEKILKGLLKEYEITDRDDLIGTLNCVYDYERFLNNDKINVWKNLGNSKQKLHTIREDKTDRWKPGTKIDFFINCRQPNMFRFAPVIPVVSTQTIEFIPIDDENYCIYIDGKALTENQINQLAINDGFDSTLDFLNYFQFGFVGKIIHWTDKKY